MHCILHIQYEIAEIEKDNSFLFAVPHNYSEIHRLQSNLFSQLHTL